MGLLVIALVNSGCTIDGIEEGDDLQETAPDAPGADEGTEDVGEVSQELVLGSYSASNTNSALNEANVVKIPVDIDSGETVMIGTDGLKGASNLGDTFLRLAAPSGDLIANASNDNYIACGASVGSRWKYTSTFNILKTFTVWGGCNGSSSCGSNTVVVSRRKGHFSYSASNTSQGTTGTTNREIYFLAGRWIRASTCHDVAADAGHNGDTVLRLYRRDGAAVFQVTSNDDSVYCSAGCGTGSTILYQVPSDGYYQIHAGCYLNTACSGTVAVYAE